MTPEEEEKKLESAQIMATFFLVTSWILSVLLALASGYYMHH